MLQRERHFTGRTGRVVVAAAGVLALATTGLDAPPAGASAPSVLNIAFGPVASVTGNENPLFPTSDLSNFNVTDFVYEPLLQWDLEKPNTVYPWLATSYAWSDGGRTLTFDIRKGVSWSDGKPFTANDVAFTFKLLKDYPSLNVNGVTFSSVTAPNPYTVVFHFPTPQYVRLYFIGSQVIVPEHIWGDVANPVKFLDKDPVGTGPYLVSSASGDELVLTKNPHYWQEGEPKVDKLVLPTYESNTGGDLALGSGSDQYGDLFYSDIQRAFIDGDPAYRHDWFPAVSDEYLVPNLATYPLNQLPVREAISDAVNRRELVAVGEQNEAAYDPSPTGLVLPLENSWLAPQYASLHYSVNIAKANQILNAAGYKMGKNGIRVDPKGKPLVFTAMAPSAFTDAMTDLSIISSELKQIGIDVVVNGVAYSTYVSDLDLGDYQLSWGFGQTPVNPYYDFYSLDTSNYAPVGKSSSSDPERWDNSMTTRLLNTLAATDNVAAEKSAVDQLETVMVKQLPVILMFYNAVQQEWSTKDFVGWPTAQDPYSWGAYSPEDELVILHLKPR